MVTVIMFDTREEFFKVLQSVHCNCLLEQQIHHLYCSSSLKSQWSCFNLIILSKQSLDMVSDVPTSGDTKYSRSVY